MDPVTLGAEILGGAAAAAEAAAVTAPAVEAAAVVGAAAEAGAVLETTAVATETAAQIEAIAADTAVTAEATAEQLPGVEALTKLEEPPVSGKPQLKVEEGGAKEKGKSPAELKAVKGDEEGAKKDKVDDKAEAKKKEEQGNAEVLAKLERLRQLYNERNAYQNAINILERTPDKSDDQTLDLGRFYFGKRMVEGEIKVLEAELQAKAATDPALAFIIMPVLLAGGFVMAAASQEKASA